MRVTGQIPASSGHASRTVGNKDPDPSFDLGSSPRRPIQLPMDVRSSSMAPVSLQASPRAEPSPHTRPVFPDKRNWRETWLGVMMPITVQEATSELADLTCSRSLAHLHARRVAVKGRFGRGQPYWIMNVVKNYSLSLDVSPSQLWF